MSQSKDGVSQHERRDHNIKKTRKRSPCDECDETFLNSSDRDKHVKTLHGSKRNKFSKDERRRNGFCRYWNYSKCSNENCKYLHEEAPYCRYQERCLNKHRCQFFHEESSMRDSAPFLGFPPSQAQRRRQQNHQY